jgi:hypothetical protein
MKLLLVSLSLLFLSSNVFAAKQGQDKGNGGDICENKMRNITNEIESWLLNDEYIGIKLSSNLAEKTYKLGMLNAVRKSQLSCTTDKVFVGNAEKSCTNFRDNRGNARIVCNFDRFLKTEEKEKYKLMHHEFAGVAHFESNNGKETSVYKISNQISDFLHKEEILKLGIKPDIQVEGNLGYSPNAMVIKNVTICYVTCNSVGFNIDHNAIKYGTISFADYNEANSSNARICSSEAKVLGIASDRASGERSFGIDLEECSKILTGKYRGEKVNLISEELSNEKTYVTHIELK